MSQSLVTVESRSTRIEAEIVKGRLEASGIKAFILADDAGGMYPFPNQSGFARVLVQVSKKDFIKAKKVLKSV
jgi:hypothetical protein